MQKTGFISEQERFMRMAVSQARMAAMEGEAPVGAVMVKDGKVIAAARNRREHLGDPCAHAEITAMRVAARYLGQRRLDGCVMYVTLEPCAMCAGAIAINRLKAAVFGAHDPVMGGCGGAMSIIQRFSPKTLVAGGVMEAVCAQILSDFFAGRRG